MSEKKFTIEPEVIEDIYFRLGIESPTNKKQRDRERNLIRSGYEMAYQNQQPEVMSSGTAIISDENGVPTKVHLSDKEKLTEMTFNNEIEEVKSQIQELQEKLKKLEHQEPVKQKDTLYQMLYDESAYGHIGLYDAFKVVKDWLYGNSITVTEDYSTVTLKLRKGAFGDAN